jgi:hypothetical protein
MTGYGLHVIGFPSGKFGFVGSVPAALLGWRPPTALDAMAGRVNPATGLAHYTLVFASPSAAVTFAKAKGFTARVAPTA